MRLRDKLVMFVFIIALASGVMAVTGYAASDDVYKPYLYGVFPSGNITTNSTLVGASFNDFPPSSGIDSAAVSVYLDGVLLSGCTVNGVAQGNVNCPVAGLSYGSHGVIVNIADMAGNTNSISGYFTVSPSCAERTPLDAVLDPDHGLPGSAFSLTPVLDRSFADPMIFWDETPISGFWNGGTVTLTVPEGAAAGPHTVRVWTVDNAYGEFCSLEVSKTYTVDTPCQGSRPVISLFKARVYWASYSDYTARALSVDNFVRNKGADVAYDVRITGSTGTNSVTFLTDTPVILGDIPSGADRSFTLAFDVPAGVGSFMARINASAQDSCGNSYTYPK